MFPEVSINQAKKKKKNELENVFSEGHRGHSII